MNVYELKKKLVHGRPRSRLIPETSPSPVGRWLRQSEGPAGPAHPTHAAPQHRPRTPSPSRAAGLWATPSTAHTHTQGETGVRGQDINMLGIICVCFFLFFSSLVKTLIYSFENLRIWKSLESQSAMGLCSLNHDCLQISNLQVHPGVKLRLKVS